MSINPSNFLAFGTIDLGAEIQRQTQVANQVTATLTFPSNTTTLQKQSIAFNNPIIITESQISAQMDGSPLNGDQEYTFGPAIQNRTVMVGVSVPNYLAFSNDGIVFNPLGTSIQVNYGIIWDGIKWIGININTVSISYNGINWQTVATIPNVSGISRISYNGQIYLATYTDGGNIAYSYDGINWNVTKSQVASNSGITWNGSFWLCNGINTTGANTISYSQDGIIWTGLGNPTTGASRPGSVCWNGVYWVLVYTNRIIINNNPSGQGTWTTVNTTIFNTVPAAQNGFSVAWNGKIMIATGPPTETSTGNIFAYSPDGVNWTGLGNIIYNTTISLYGGKTVWNGKHFINGYSQATTENSFATSYDGINWLGKGVSPLIRPYDIGFNALRPHSITFQRNMTIASGNGGDGGNIMGYSYDGINWNACKATFGTIGANQIVYNGRLWVAGCNNTTGNCIAISKDGINWDGIGSFGLTAVNSIVWSGKLWVAGGSSATNSPNNVLYSYDGYTWTPGTGRTWNIVLFVVYNNNIFFSCESTTIYKSTDGINWKNTPSTTTNTTIRCANVVNNIFVLNIDVETYFNNFVYSYDGDNWISTFSITGLGTSSNGRFMLWDGIKYLHGTTNATYYSYNFVDWTITNTSNSSHFLTYNGTIYNQIRFDFSSNSLSSSGYSYDGITWVRSTMFRSLFTGLLRNISNNYGVKPIPFIQHPTLALGSGTTTIAYSPDGITWNSLGNSTFTVQANTAFWSGSIWIAGGEGGNTMAYSYDGVQWTGFSNPFTTAVTGIAYNGNTWVAVGMGGNTVAYSSNGLTWTGSSLGFTSGGSIFWNGTVFMITYNASSSQSTYISTTGISWTLASVSNLNGIPASNGYTWISGTSGQANNLYYANASNPDSVNPWTSATPTIFTTSGNCVCYGGTIWVAGGLGGNTLAYSFNGTSWVGLGTTAFPNGCSSICWNGTRFIGAGGNYVGYSKDGITWYSSRSIITSLNYVVSNPGIGAYVAPSAMVLNKSGISGNGMAASQTLEFVSSDPYFQQGFDNVSIQLNAKYNN